MDKSQLKISEDIYPQRNTSLKIRMLGVNVNKTKIK